MMQTTLGKKVTLKGVGLHTGSAVQVTLQSAPPDTGLVFRRTDLEGFEIEAINKNVAKVLLATTLMKRGVMLWTVEHLLSSLYGMGVSNAFIDINSLEVPILDGSALLFVKAIRESGIVEQAVPRRCLVIQKSHSIREGGKEIRVEPCSDFEASYEIDFDHPAIGCQSFSLAVKASTYQKEIAFARTFGFQDEVDELLRKGLIQGGSLDNAVVLSANGLLNGPLRSSDEFVRHKILDLIGDLSLSGHYIKGRVLAYKAGHALHCRLVTDLLRDSTLAVSECLTPATSANTP